MARRSTRSSAPRLRIGDRRRNHSSAVLQKAWWIPADSNHIRALQGRWVKVCKVIAHVGDLNVEDHAISLDHSGIRIHDENLPSFGGLSRKKPQEFNSCRVSYW